MKTILLIDHDKDVRDTLSLMLELEGYAVKKAATEEEGLAYHQAFPASVVITDVVVFSHDTRDPIERWGKRLPIVPVIAMSATIPFCERESEQLACTSNPVCTLQKPFTVDELLHTIQTVLPKQEVEEHFQ